MDIVLKTIPEPVAKGLSVLRITSAPSSDGPDNYICGQCKKILFNGINNGQLTNVVIKCEECGSCNGVPTPTDPFYGNRPPGIAAIKRQDQIFKDDLVYLSGFFYENCTFQSCTFVIKNIPGLLKDCVISGCNLHLDVMVTSKQDAHAFAALLTMFSASLPDASLLPEASWLPTHEPKENTSEKNEHSDPKD